MFFLMPPQACLLFHQTQTGIIQEIYIYPARNHVFE